MYVSVVKLKYITFLSGLKYTLFDKLLLEDTFLLGVGGSVVVALMWCYTGSLFITLVTITTVACALIIAYFMYIFIYEITFFPYMNVLTAVIAIGEYVCSRWWELFMFSGHCAYPGGEFLPVSECVLFAL